MALRPLLLVVVVSSAILPASDARFYCISNFLYTLDGGGICTRDANGLVEATGQRHRWPFKLVMVGDCMYPSWRF